jgi:hypothetical protein
MITLNDAEQRFADSPEGAAKLAYERSKFETSHAYMGDRAPKWTDSMEARLVRDMAAQQARDSVNRAAFLADSERQLPAARAAAETARQMMIADLNSSRRR